MNWIGYLGLALLVMALLAVLAAVVTLLPRALRLRRVSNETVRLLEMYRQAIDLSITERDELVAEREVLVRPLRGLRRVAAHPLTIALIESYRLRRRRARAAAL